MEYVSKSASSKFKIPFRTVSVTASPAKKAPKNSKIAAAIIAFLKVRAPLPTLVPIALATSFAPMFQAMYPAIKIARNIIKSSPNMNTP